MKKYSAPLIPFKKLSQTALSAYANAHRLAISVAPGLTNFPDIPNDAATLQGLISDYNTALAAAYKGSKTQTDTKDEAKSALITALQANWQYVLTFAKATLGDYVLYDEFKAFIATSGFSTNNDPTPAGILKAPIIRLATSPGIGIMKVVLNAFSKSGKQRTGKVVGAKSFTLFYRTAAIGSTPAGPWLDSIQSSYILIVDSLPSGTYEIYVVANGRSKTKQPTNITTVVVL